MSGKENSSKASNWLPRPAPRGERRVTMAQLAMAGFPPPLSSPIATAPQVNQVRSSGERVPHTHIATPFRTSRPSTQTKPISAESEQNMPQPQSVDKPNSTNKILTPVSELSTSFSMFSNRSAFGWASPESNAGEMDQTSAKIEPALNDSVSTEFGTSFSDNWKQKLSPISIESGYGDYGVSAQPRSTYESEALNEETGNWHEIAQTPVGQRMDFSAQREAKENASSSSNLDHHQYQTVCFVLDRDGTAFFNTNDEAFTMPPHPMAEIRIRRMLVSAATEAPKISSILVKFNFDVDGKQPNTSYKTPLHVSTPSSNRSFLDISALTPERVDEIARGEAEAIYDGGPDNYETRYDDELPEYAYVPDSPFTLWSDN